MYYNKYPADVARVRRIMAYLESHKVVLPNGGTLSPVRFQQLGIDFGKQGLSQFAIFIFSLSDLWFTGGIDSVHRESF